jgi:hypothetical protein
MSREALFKGLPTEPGYNRGFDDGHKVGEKRLALYREYFECHQAMTASIKAEDFAKAAARANELRGILSGETP